MAFQRSVSVNILTIAGCVTIAYYIRTWFPAGQIEKSILEYPKESLVNFTQYAIKYRYIAEEHTIVTDDGYILSVFRIQNKKCEGRTHQPPVMLMHGLTQSSDTFLDAGPNAGLAYLLADACYDIWVGNQRGNYYARRHVILDPDKDPTFWNFSFDEMGYYDVPAMIDYVLDHTGYKKLNYIGYSQGDAVFIIMCSERPDYCSKVHGHISLSPASRLMNTKSLYMRSVCITVSKLETLLAGFGINEVFSIGAFMQILIEIICKCETITEPIAGTLISGVLDAYHTGSITSETLHRMSSHFPSGTSLHNLAHYGQTMQNDRFQKFDYGETRNLIKYGSKEPPTYNISLVTPPTVLLYSRNDNLVDKEDLDWFIDKLPNLLEIEEIADPMFNHLDIVYSQYGKELVFPFVCRNLQRFSVPKNESRWV
ncbi:unnamed protein product [Leptidea sinapis]|uniref:Lipase n=1 Tax=Leptidea sinapis TaxID=189913 RepID=A0A5E4Q4Z6_9NEOP|nr:unnamed protein product [Leptidea sinapis]